MQIDLEKLLSAVKKEVKSNKAVSLNSVLSKHLASITAEFKSMIRAAGLDVRNGLIRMPAKLSKAQAKKKKKAPAKKKKTTKKKVVKKKK